MKKQLKKILLPILLLGLPLSAIAVTTTMTAHIGEMNNRDMWVISGEENSPTNIGRGLLISKSNEHTGTIVLDFNVTNITYCVGKKKKCMPDGNIDRTITCPLTDHTQGNSGNSKVDIYLYPDHDYCQAVKYSV